ncbi:hypothetical protein VOLCADRAFT_87898 [Volvox carteri f. nagariensis]|uniref:Uncharacterized protein n=1 Tax=Volvox carteri f. nagariensis TaxID=3068 RepID=D8TMJ1_VOLCA|nr:uncharacterized protein VOLCADRAFT_87898 [Volvox carteri f. nagariensis]EFJ51132.1 hypothetical protein VOLCADRAFT_87898 [Volvox carteri f. nagariensis]|eukprot:XP_002947599.1 hypothetical protein VOLCADRAFT_87898 [Volvox carteri f. nagariensis]
METEDDFCLDEARETLFTFQRACERRAAALGNIVDVLNRKQPDDEWLLEVLDEAEKGIAFHQQQLEMFTNFHARANAYVEALREEANRLAIQELADGSDDQRRKASSKIVHPELLKFKLEKQAKILGKYGGIPALGAGRLLPKVQRDAILKQLHSFVATGSAAAREIHYSKVENKDAANLAQVMRFKVRRADGEDVGANGGTPTPSPWQAELSAKKGKTALDGTDQKDQVTPSTRTHTIYAEELGGVLQQRQAALEEALAAQARPTPPPAIGPVISADAGGELADKLRRRQSVAKQIEAAEAATAAAEAAEAAEAAAQPTAPAWSNPAAPFGGELTAAIQRRAEQQRQQQRRASSSGGEGPDTATAAADAVTSTAGREESGSSVTSAEMTAGPRPVGRLGSTRPPGTPTAAPTPGLRTTTVPATAAPAAAAAASVTPAAAGFATPVWGLTLGARGLPRAAAPGPGAPKKRGVLFGQCQGARHLVPRNRSSGAPAGIAVRTCEHARIFFH